MIEFGRTLRAAREAKGYTIAQMAETTHMAPTIVEDLEKEDFTHIPAPIYGRGFVKLYCEAVGIDPKPLVAEFMEIFNGNHDTSIKERPVAQPATAPEPPIAPEPTVKEAKPPAPPEPPVAPVPPLKEPVPLPTPEPEPPPAPEPEPDLFAPPPPMPKPVTAPEPPPTAPEPFDNIFSAPVQPEPEPPRLSRYAAPISQTQPTPSTNFISPAAWRIAALACAALVVIWLAFIGVRALYRATSNPDSTETHTTSLTAEEATAANAAKQQEESAKPETKPGQAKEAAPAKPAKTAQPAATRKPQDIPALYID